MKIFYKPFGIIAGIIGGKLGSKVFNQVWGSFEELQPRSALSSTG